MRNSLLQIIQLLLILANLVIAKRNPISRAYGKVITANHSLLNHTQVKQKLECLAIVLSHKHILDDTGFKFNSLTGECVVGKFPKEMIFNFVINGLVEIQNDQQEDTIEICLDCFKSDNILLICEQTNIMISQDFSQSCVVDTLPRISRHWGTAFTDIYDNNRVIYCGGHNPYSGGDQSNCLTPSEDLTTWQEYPNSDFGYVYKYPCVFELSPGKFWIISGMRTNGGQILTTKIFENGVFSDGPNIDFHTSYACCVQIDNTLGMMAFIYGGNKKAYLIDLVNLSLNRTADSINPTNKDGTGCGWFKNTQGEIEVAFTGGHGTTSTYIFSLKNQTWRQGADLPAQSNHQRSVQREGYFYLPVGSKFYRFDSQQQWIEQPLKLSDNCGRYEITKVSKENFSCQ